MEVQRTRIGFAARTDESGRFGKALAGRTLAGRTLCRPLAAARWGADRRSMRPPFWVCVVLAIGLTAMPASHRDAFAGFGYGWGGAFNPDSNEAKFDVDGPARFEPMFAIQAGVLSLKRSANDAQNIAFTDGTVGPVQPIATATDLDAEAMTGSRVKVSLFNLSEHLPGLDMDASFISADDQTGQMTIRAADHSTTNVIPFFFGGIPASPVDTYTITIDSDFNTSDWNLIYRPGPRVKLLAGLRWLRLKEDYDIVQGSGGGGGGQTGFFTQSVNDAFGFQIGAEGTLWTNGVFRAYGSFKYAWLRNDVDGNAISSNFQINFYDKPNTNLLDLEFGASARISHCILAQVSYQGLFLDDLASVLGQADVLDLTGSDDQQPVYTDVSWNGVYFGLTFIW